jgi:hypothetical protein
MSFLNQAREDIETRKAAAGSGGGGRLYFRVGENDTQIVRFLDEGDELESKNVAWFHKTPPSEGRPYGTWVPCRDQDVVTGARIGEPCPGCERNAEDYEVCKRQVHGFVNIIWRNAPVFTRDDKGKIVKEGNKPVVEGYADQLAVWEAGYNVFDELVGLDTAVKGLKSRDFKVTRTGTSFNTKYTILPVDFDAGPQPMSEADKEIEGTKRDFEPDVTPSSYEEWGKQKKKQAEGGGSSETPVSSDSPFLRK